MNYYSIMHTSSYIHMYIRSCLICVDLYLFAEAGKCNYLQILPSCTNVFVPILLLSYIVLNANWSNESAFRYLIESKMSESANQKCWTCFSEINLFGFYSIHLEMIKMSKNWKIKRLAY